MLTTVIFRSSSPGANLTMCPLRCLQKFCVDCPILFANRYLHFGGNQIFTSHDGCNVCSVSICVCVKVCWVWASTYVDAVNQFISFILLVPFASVNSIVIPLLGLTPLIHGSCKTTSTPVPSNT